MKRKAQAAWTGSGMGGVVSTPTKGGFELRPVLTIGRPFDPRLILSLKPSSSTANSVSSERFMSSIICLICLRSKRCLGCKLIRLEALVVIRSWSFKRIEAPQAISDFLRYADCWRKRRISVEFGQNLQEIPQKAQKRGCFRDLLRRVLDDFLPDGCEF